MAFVRANVNYAHEYSQELANAMPYLSYFGALFDAENSVKYRPLRGKVVEIPSLSVSGARAADRDQITGEFSRNWNNAWQAVELEMDREWDTLIDPLDMEETNRVATVANITRTFNEQQKVPEMDAYVASKLASLAIAAGHGDTTALTKDNILDKWDDILAQMTNARFNRDRVVAYMTPDTYKVLKEAAGITRFVDTGAGFRGVDRNVARLDGVEIREVPGDMMKTVYDFQTGWAAGAGAKQINLALYDPMAIAAPIVYDVSMIEAPTAGNKGKYLYYERYYYDVFLLTKRNAGVYANIDA